MKIKVCGITALEDAHLCASMGVDALGFNFYPRSPRYIPPREAREIIRTLPPFLVTVGLVVNVEDAGQVAETAHTAGVQAIQLHGDETPDYCRRLAEWTLIKAVRIGRSMPDGLESFPVQAWLLDSLDEFRFGGTGRSFSWELAQPVARQRTVILAGGLSAANVAEAIRIVQPYAVDVCSGVESLPGRKSAAKLQDFIREVRGALG